MSSESPLEPRLENWARGHTSQVAIKCIKQQLGPKSVIKQADWGV